MVIFHSYVSLPEGKWMSPRALRGSPEPTRCSDLGSQVDLEALVNAAMDEMRSWVSQVAPTRLWRTWLLLVHAEWFFPQNCDTVDGFEIRNTTPIWDVWKPINSGMFTTVFNWCRISQPSTVMCVKQCHLHHPPVITIFIGGIFTIPSHGLFTIVLPTLFLTIK